MSKQNLNVINYCSGKYILSCLDHPGSEDIEKCLSYAYSAITGGHMKSFFQRLFIPNPKLKHITVEGYNSILRHFVAKLRIKTKCYTKSLEMLSTLFSF